MKKIVTLPAQEQPRLYDTTTLSVTGRVVAIRVDEFGGIEVDLEIEMPLPRGETMGLEFVDQHQGTGHLDVRPSFGGFN